MAIRVNLLTFSKRVNSTKVPTSTQISAGQAFDCVLLDDTSLLKPIFKLSHASNPIGYNYAYVSDFGRYYFVDDIVSSKGFWLISCHVDPMATYKTAIGSGSHYVLRSASSYDEYISDQVYITKTVESGDRVTGTVDATTNTDPFSYYNGHSYVWCITGDVITDTLVNQQIGSNVYYWMDDRECYSFINYLLDVQDYSGINQSTEYSEAMQKALMNPIQYVNSVILLPFSKNSSLATNNTVKFGYYDITLNPDDNPSVKRLTQGTMVKQQILTIQLPKHPQAATRGKFMNGSPYTSYELFMGPFGNIPIDPASLIDEVYLKVTCNTECCSGMTQIFVKGQSSSAPMIYTGTAQVGVPVTVSELTRDYLGEVKNQLDMQTGTIGALTSVVMGGAGAATGVTGSIQSIGSMAFDAVRMKYPTVMGGGANGNFLGLHSQCYLQAKFYECVDQNITEIGRPLYKNKTINTLSGFICCSGADVAISGTEEEADIINNYMNSGFFYE